LKLLKRGLLISGILLGIMIAVIVIFGNYLVNYALVRRDSSYNVIESNAAVNDTFLSDCTVLRIASADDLLLEASMLRQETNGTGEKWVILLHGYHADRSSMLSFAEEYYKSGYNILMPDMRAHGASEGTYIGMGWLDSQDVLLWINKVLKVDPYAKIVLHGVSMGAATVMMTAGDPNLQYNVVAAIEDCGYTSVWDIFEERLKEQFGLPAFPVLHVASQIAALRAGYDFKEASALRQVKRCKIPMLFIHGEEDDFVPYSMVGELYDAAICQKELLTVEGAGHAASEETNPQLYWNTVFDFLETYGEQ